MATIIEFVRCVLLSVVIAFVLLSVLIARTLSHGFVEGRRNIEVKDRELVRHKAAVKSIESEDGDVIDCVDIYKQPAFDHPLLKNHKIQMKPSLYPIGMKAFNYTVEIIQPWHESGQCPRGTIPIKRTRKCVFPRAAPLSSQEIKIGRNTTEITAGVHEYAALYVEGKKYYGAQASINLRNPKVEQDYEMTLSQIWVIGGRSETLNTAEAGLMVYPHIYGDSQTRLFLYWTSDNYVSTGCYNLDCPGFVQTNGDFAMGSIIRPVSNYGVQQLALSFTIFKDKRSGNWWLLVQGKLLGYWPSSIYTTLAGGASAVSWGGEIFNTKSQGHHTSTQMGSGHFPHEGYWKSSYFRNLGVVDASDTIRDPVDLVPIISNTLCYDLQIQENKNTDYGYYFYYGGPGYSQQCP
ncbi:hypothetical protein HHK36_006254 [Tetracentron sinense]|uniref:Neprosin PEP catalytic domain-containing protein n=1 Tax=Tetracentron sinense TaxID=13715 RepID=A0A834ZGX0_TETSI|nr:hypothetical protein HHK36_006254 [Tetracentron sinense]